MSTTDVSICSTALLLLGAQSINSLDDTTDRARIVATVYPFIRDKVLRSFPWNCCIKRVILSPDTEAPAFDWNFQFTLPSDFVKPLQVGLTWQEDEFKIEGRKLLSDENPCYLRYVFLNTNAGSWDAGLVAVVTAELVAALAYPITQSASLADTKTKEAMVVTRQARAVDGQDDTPEQLGDERLLSARFGSTL
jgi:hypothetical protein